MKSSSNISGFGEEGKRTPGVNEEDVIEEEEDFPEADDVQSDEVDDDEDEDDIEEVTNNEQAAEAIFQNAGLPNGGLQDFATLFQQQLQQQRQLQEKARSQTELQEWSGLSNFAATTQSTLQSVLNTLRASEMDSLTVLVVGSNAVGKTALVSALLGERVIPPQSTNVGNMMGLMGMQMQQTGPNPKAPRMYSRTAANFTFNIIDSSSLMAQGGPDEVALSLLSDFLSDGKKVDVVLYLDRLDLYRVDSRDKQSMDALTRVLGPEIWKKACITLTRGQMKPVGMDYDDFVEKRGNLLRKAVRKCALSGGLSKNETLKLDLPVVAVELSQLCATNENGEKILPNKSPWMTTLFQTMGSLATADSLAFTHNAEEQETICNQKGKRWAVPLFFLQTFLIFPIMRHMVQQDMNKEIEHSLRK